MKGVRALVLVAALAAGPLALAASAPVEDDRVLYPGRAAPAPAPVDAGPWSQITLIAGLVLAAAGGWLVWRGRRQPGGRSGEARALAIAETRPLGNRQYLVVAAYENKKFLLGVCPGRIDLLARLHDDQAGP